MQLISQMSASAGDKRGIRRLLCQWLLHCFFWGLGEAPFPSHCYFVPSRGLGEAPLSNHCYFVPSGCIESVQSIGFLMSSKELSCWGHWQRASVRSISAWMHPISDWPQLPLIARPDLHEYLLLSLKMILKTTTAKWTNKQKTQNFLLVTFPSGSSNSLLGL